MAQCFLCGKTKGKRYCSPLDNVICPICCAKSRLNTIDCNDDCRYLEGVERQAKRAEDKAYAELMRSTPHGEFDDIFQIEPAATMSYEIESLVRDMYVDSDTKITDHTAYEAYKTVYAINYQHKQIDEAALDELTQELLSLYRRNKLMWLQHMDDELIGQVFLRLMMSVKNMSGGRFGEFGYVNFLKNNLGQTHSLHETIVEDKYGRKSKFQHHQD